MHSSASSWLGMVLLVATSGALSSCRISVAVPELKVSASEAKVRAGETVEVTMDGGVPPFVFEIVSGTGQVDRNLGVFTAPEEGGEVIIRVTDADGRAKEISVQVIARLKLLSQRGVIRPGSDYTVGAAGGVPPYEFTLVSGSGTLDRATGILNAASPGSVEVLLTDAEGRSVSGSFFITANLSVSISAPAAVSTIYSGNDSSAFGVSGVCNSAGASVQVLVNGLASGSAVPCDGSTWTASIDSTVIPSGVVALGASMNDGSGATAAAPAVSLLKDVSAPVLGGLANDPASSKTKTWSWTCSETCTYRYVVDQSVATAPGGAYGTTTSAAQNSGTGTYYLHVQARDAAGNESPVVHVSAELDNTAPSAPSGLALVTPATSPGKIAAPVIRVSGTASGAAVSIFADAACSAPALKGSATASGETVDITADSLAPGNYAFYAKASDSLGNVSSCSGASVSYVYDNQAPTASVIESDPTPTRTKTWDWGCDEACTYRFVVDTNPSTVPNGPYNALSVPDTVGVTGTYYLHLQAIDAAGNESEMVHTWAVLDNTPPNTPSALTLITPASSPGNVMPAVVRVSGVAAGDIVQLYRDSSCALTASPSATAAAGAVDITTSVIPSGAYVFYAKSKDSLGNASACSTANVAYQYDNSAPSVTGLANDATAAKSKSWNWGCSETGCTYRYVIDTNATTNPGTAYDATTTVTQSSGTGIYYLHVQAKDAAGNASAVVHVSVPLDNSGPDAPGAVNDGTTSASMTSSPTISWGSSTDSPAGVSYYEIAIGTSAGGTQTKGWTNVGNVTSATVNGLSLTNNVTYFATVRAVDTAGNVSTPTNGDGWTVNPVDVVTSPKTFIYTGNDQSFVVPAGVTSVSVKLWGAGGGGLGGSKGGGGGYATGTIAVTPGDTLVVRVGGAGGSSPGWPNGGARGSEGWCTTAAGGGSSSILLGGVVQIEAGGGGGATGYYCDQADSYGLPGGGVRACSPSGNRTGGTGFNGAPDLGGGGGGGGGYCGGAGGGDGSSGGGGSSYFPDGGQELSGNGNLAGNQAVGPCSGTCGGSDRNGVVQLSWVAPGQITESFENGGSLPAGWAVGHGESPGYSPFAGMTSADKHAGSYSLGLNPDYDMSSSAEVTLNMAAAGTFTFWAKAGTIASIITVSVKGSVVGYVTPTDTWTQYGPYPYPAGSVRFYFVTDAGEMIYIDDMVWTSN